MQQDPCLAKHPYVKLSTPQVGELDQLAASWMAHGTKWLRWGKPWVQLRFIFKPWKVSCGQWMIGWGPCIAGPKEKGRQVLQKHNIEIAAPLNPKFKSVRKWGWPDNKRKQRRKWEKPQKGFKELESVCWDRTCSSLEWKSSMTCLSLRGGSDHSNSRTERDRSKVRSACGWGSISKLSKLSDSESKSMKRRVSPS